MTGRELIIHILVNNIEDKEMFVDGQIPGYMSIEELAVMYGVGVRTIKVYLSVYKVPTIAFGEKVYISERDADELIFKRKGYLK